MLDLSTIRNRADTVENGKIFRTCSKRSKVKQLDCFAKAAYCLNGHRKTCKVCDNEAKKISKEKYKAKNPRCRETLRLRYKYGLTIQQYTQILESQNGVCAICKQEETIKDKALSVDHCHKTGNIRGLLCHRCNAGIGFLKDDINILKTAIEYLGEPND